MALGPVMLPYAGSQRWESAAGDLRLRRLFGRGDTGPPALPLGSHPSMDLTA